MPDLAVAHAALAALLDDREIERNAKTSSFAVWGNVALTQIDRSIRSPASRPSAG